MQRYEKQIRCICFKEEVQSRETSPSCESFIINLGVFIRQIRERKNLSQQSLADISDLPKTTIGRIERAEINTTIRSLVKIANALEIEPKELLNFQMK